MRILFVITLILFLYFKAFAQDSASNRDKQHTVPAGRQVIDLSPEAQAKVDSLKKVISDVEKQCPEPCDADTGRINAYLVWSEELLLKEPDSALTCVIQAKEIAEAFLYSANPTTSHSASDTAKKYLASALNDIGYIYEKQGDITKALESWNKSLNIYLEIGDKIGTATSYNNIGYIYEKQGDIPKALEYYSKSLNIQEEIGDKLGMAYSFTNIGTIYYNQGDITKALEYWNKSLNTYEEIGDKLGVATSFNNIGLIYYIQSDITKALKYWNKSLNIREEIGDKLGMATSLFNIGSIYKNLGDILKALEYYNKSLCIQEEIGDKIGLANSLYHLGKYSQKQNKVLQFKQCAIRGYKLSKEMGLPEIIEKSASLMKDLMVSQGNYKKAYEYYQEEIAMRDSVQNEENYKATQKQQARYEYQKQKAVDSVAHHKAIEIKDLSLAKKEEETKRQQVVIYSFIAGFIIIIVFSILLFRMFLQKKKANLKLAQQNDEIAAQRDEIETQRDMVTEQRDHIAEIHEEITSSISYAKRIQAAVLPSDKNASDILGEHFIVFRPHSVVSGDFYWATKTEEWTVVTAADCTGHGVPGAFMSMLGVSFLNEIVRKKELTSSAEVLNQLRASVIEALKQTGEQGTHLTAEAVKDGMDMSIIAIHKDRTRALWAGANNPLWIIRNVKTLHATSQRPYETSLHSEDHLLIEEHKGDSMPVAVHDRMDNFTNHEISLNKGDLLFLFTDGYPDQFGGKKGKKFMYKPFKRLLVENARKTMSKQKEALETELDEWMNFDGNKYEQVDDITVVGLRI